MILWFLKILRLLFAFFDRIAFTLIEWVYELFMLIAEAGIFSQATIQEFAARIYVFLGLIMVFKVSISLVTYILNPDNFNKADVGAPALLKGFVFALLGIVLVPYVFEAAYSLQRIVLKDNLIGNLIMGMSANNNNSSNYLEDAGNQMSFVTLTAFLRLDTKFSQVSEACSADPVTVNYEDKTGELSAECDGLAEIMGDDAVNLLIKAYSNRSIEYLTDGDLLNVTVTTDENDDEFLMSYLPIVSTAAGIFIAYVLLLFCVDIAVRSVKLGFLQLIAPIPLIAKVDPKKGGKIFDNWVKECSSTYLDVFMRLAAIYFVLFIISAITGSGNNGIYNVVTGKGYSGISGIFVKIFIIIGALNFARDLPKLLGKILGIDFKGAGGFTLNAKKKLGATPLIGGALNEGLGLMGRTGMNLARGGFTAAGAGIGALDNATGFNSWRANRSADFRNSKFGRGLSTFGNKIDALESRAMAKAGAIGHAVNDVTGGAMSRIGSDASLAGAGMAGAVQNSLGVLEAKERRLANREAAILDRQSNGKLEMERNKTMVGANDAVEARAKKKVAESSEYIQRQQNIENLKQNLKNSMSSMNSNNTSIEKARQAMEAAANDSSVSDSDRQKLAQEYNSYQQEKDRLNAEINQMNSQIVDETSSFNKWANKDGVYDYINNTTTDDVLNSLVSKRDQTAQVLGMADAVVGKDAKTISDFAGSLQNANTGIEASFVESDQQLSQIKEEKRQISETKRASSPFMGPGMGGKSGK